MREIIKTVLRMIYLEDLARELLRNPKHFKRYWAGTDKRIIDHYFRNQGIRKLHIGCGQNILTGWLNSDYDPGAPDILRLDATKPFPFENDQFHYVFSEHMIEHIPYLQGLQMLTECHRVLRPKGTLRIATPDLAFLVDLYRSNKSELQQYYVKWTTDTFIAAAPYYEDTFVINNFVRDWGHQFIYDEKVLRYSLEKVGFRDIRKCDLNNSEDKELINLENENRYPPGFLRMETIILEGTKLFQLSS